ncbi:MAG: hypothetical protein ACLSFT_11640 [Ruminococcus callidus]
MPLVTSTDTRQGHGHCRHSGDDLIQPIAGCSVGFLHFQPAEERFQWRFRHRGAGSGSGAWVPAVAPAAELSVCGTVPVPIADACAV